VTAGSRGGSGRARLARQAYVRNPADRPEAGRRALVSVIIPMYNYGHFLPATVDSALCQDHVDVELIIVDDASSDDSATVARRLVTADPRVTLLSLTANSGPARAFNSGYERATGEFIVRLDADDLLTPGSLARAVALFDAFPGVGLVYGHPLHFDGDVPDAASARQQVRSWSTWSGHDWIAERCRRGVNCITTPEAIVRASVMASVGNLSTEIPTATDIHLWLRVAAESDVGRVDGTDQALHREHAASITGRAEYTDMVDLTERKAVFDDFFSGPGKKLADAGELYRTANASLADEALLQACRAYDRGRTGSVDVSAFTDFALLTYPDARQLPHWGALRRRQLLGPALSAAPGIFTGSQVSRRLRGRLAYRRWQHTGL
jgi:glycosyl transferase family 2